MSAWNEKKSLPLPLYPHRIYDWLNFKNIDLSPVFIFNVLYLRHVCETVA